MFQYGDMWAEAGTSFYPVAESGSLKSIFIPDPVGYLTFSTRIISLIGFYLNLKASWIPYFYNYAGAICVALMVGMFCLPCFRRVIKNDILRLGIVWIVLALANYEMRTYICFPYFSAFPIMCLTALALIDHEKQVTKWCWLIPLLLIAKPSVLATIPAIAMVALISKSRFRFIAITSLALAIWQIFKLYLQYKHGVYSGNYSIDLSTKSKLLASIAFGLGYTVSHFHISGNSLRIIIGSCILLITAITIIKTKRKESSIIIISATVILSSGFINCFAASNFYNLKNINFGDWIWKYNLVPFHGFVLWRSNIPLFRENKERRFINPHIYYFLLALPFRRKSQKLKH